MQGQALAWDFGDTGEPGNGQHRVLLGRLEDLSGISLDEFASALGLPEERPREWRSGAVTNADEMWGLIQWACRLPGGLSVLLTGCPHSLTVRR